MSQKWVRQSMSSAACPWPGWSDPRHTRRHFVPARAREALLGRHHRTVPLLPVFPPRSFPQGRPRRSDDVGRQHLPPPARPHHPGERRLGSLSPPGDRRSERTSGQDSCSLSDRKFLCLQPSMGELFMARACSRGAVHFIGPTPAGGVGPPAACASHGSHLTSQPRRVTTPCHQPPARRAGRIWLLLAPPASNSGGAHCSVVWAQRIAPARPTRAEIPMYPGRRHAIPSLPPRPAKTLARAPVARPAPPAARATPGPPQSARFLVSPYAGRQAAAPVIPQGMLHHQNRTDRPKVRLRPGSPLLSLLPCHRRTTHRPLRRTIPRPRISHQTTTHRFSLRHPETHQSLPESLNRSVDAGPYSLASPEKSRQAAATRPATSSFR